MGDLNAGRVSPTPNILGFNGVFFLGLCCCLWFCFQHAKGYLVVLLLTSLLSLFLTSLDFTLPSLPALNCLSFRSHHISVSLVLFFPCDVLSFPSSIKRRVMKPRVVFPFVDLSALVIDVPGLDVD